MRIQDSVVVVTGASWGIGRATAIHLARGGARVLAVARDTDRLQELARENPNITPFTADVTRDEDRAALLEAAGPIDILVNNAGVGWTGMFADMPQSSLRTLLEVNVFGLMDLTRRVLPGMIERCHGHILNVGSVVSYTPIPLLTVYSSTKFAVLGFTDALRRELTGTGVTVATVNPGPIGTGFLTRAAGGDHRSAHAQVPGIPVSVVARAVKRSIRMRRVPGYDTIAAPRIMGLARVGGLPIVKLLIDVAATAGLPIGRSQLHQPE